MRVGINGFGRIGRLALRAGWRNPDFEFVVINEPSPADAEGLALLLEFDSVQGRWDVPCAAAGGDELAIGGKQIVRTSHASPADVRWGDHGVDVVLESSGRFRTLPSLDPHFENGARRVLVSAPMKDAGSAPDVVVGVNDAGIDFANERVLTAASCTTNCLAPVTSVLHEAIGIERGLVTTIHDPTNTQTVHDRALADPRRSRSALNNLIPTSTNSATAVGRIIPALAGKLDSVAVRAPVLNASLTDCVFQVSRDTAIDEVNEALRLASFGHLAGILGFETRPLVSSDFVGDPRSGIVDALSTRVTDRRLIKVLAWYDNEWGYANRIVELLARMARATAARVS